MSNEKSSLAHLGFQRFEPSIRLSTLVDCYWFINSEELVNVDEYLHADGGMGIILNYGDVLQFDGASACDSSVFNGINTATKKLSLKGVLNAVGIRFKPAGASLLLAQPLRELKNETISLNDTNLKGTAELCERLSEAHELYLKVAIIEGWLCDLLQVEKRISAIVSTSLMLLEKHNGLVSIKSISSKLDCNQRRMERLFSLEVGVSPKEYSGILRAEQARTHIKSNKGGSFAMMAHGLGYYDQAHFINAFKKIVGITPLEYSIRHASKRQQA